MAPLKCPSRRCPKLVRRTSHSRSALPRCDINTENKRQSSLRLALQRPQKEGSLQNVAMRSETSATWPLPSLEVIRVRPELMRRPTRMKQQIQDDRGQNQCSSDYANRRGSSVAGALDGNH